MTVTREGPAVGDGPAQASSDDRRAAVARRTGGALLAAGGLASAAGASLRWWGPDRRLDLAARQDGAADPLASGTGAAAAPAGELVAGGQLLAALGLLALAFLPWGRRRTWLAVPVLLLGVLTIAAQPILWVLDRLGHPGGSAVLEGLLGPWVGGLNAPSLVWVTGLGPVVLAVCAAGAAASGRGQFWRPLVPALGLLSLGCVVVEYPLLTLITGASSGDPTGAGVFRGLGLALAGAVALAGTLARPARRPAVDASTDEAGDDLVGPRDPGDRLGGPRTAWAVGGAALALAGVAGAMAGVTRLVTTDAPLPGPEPTVVPSTTWLVLCMVCFTLMGTGVVALAFGPWRGARRSVAAALALLGLVDVAVGLYVSLPGADAPGASGPGALVAAGLVGAPTMIVLLGFTALAASERVATSRPEHLGVLAAACALYVASRPALWPTLGGDPTRVATLAVAAEVLPAVGTAFVGLAWWWVAVSAVRTRPRPGPDGSPA